MARLPDPRREQYWRQHHLRQHSSGLSIGAYCARERISFSSFYVWKKRLAPSLPAIPEPPLFLPVKVASLPYPGGAVAGPGIEIELSNYVRLRLDSLPEPEWLCRITAGLASRLNKEVIP
jgi:hypothetical protein